GLNPCLSTDTVATATVLLVIGDGRQKMSQSQTGTDKGPGFVRTLGTFDALFIGFGAMIGFGWVVLTGDWLTGAGTLGAILAFVIGGIIMCFVGTVYSEMVAAMPHAGGEHNYLIRALGPRISLFGSWAITGGYISVVMFEAVAAPQTALYLFPELEKVKLWTIADSDVYLTWALVGTVSAIVIAFINVRGVRLASLVQTFVVSFSSSSACSCSPADSSAATSTTLNRCSPAAPPASSASWPSSRSSSSASTSSPNRPKRSRSRRATSANSSSSLWSWRSSSTSSSSV